MQLEFGEFGGLEGVADGGDLDGQKTRWETVAQTRSGTKSPWTWQARIEKAWVEKAWVEEACRRQARTGARGLGKESPRPVCKMCWRARDREALAPKEGNRVRVVCWCIP